jgi:hypothetical protein
MSGPIVRKYGFPNYDNIFGERPLQHGVDEHDTPGDRPEKAPDKKAKPKAAKPKSSKSKKT